MMLRLIAAGLIAALSACGEADLSQPEALRGRTIVALDELPDDINTSESFGCDGEWSAVGGWATSGTYTIEPGRICTPTDGPGRCRAFVGAESGSIIRLGGTRYEVRPERADCD